MPKGENKCGELYVLGFHHDDALPAEKNGDDLGLEAHRFLTKKC